MNYRNGTIVSVNQCGGCMEVVVEGEAPGCFIIDNGCVWAIVGCEGTDWIGREVEYEEGMLRFLDSEHVSQQV